MSRDSSGAVAWLYEMRGASGKIEELVTVNRIPDNGTWLVEFPLVIKPFGSLSQEIEKFLLTIITSPVEGPISHQTHMTANMILKHLEGAEQ